MSVHLQPLWGTFGSDHFPNRLRTAPASALADIRQDYLAPVRSRAWAIEALSIFADLRSAARPPDNMPETWTTLSRNLRETAVRLTTVRHLWRKPCASQSSVGAHCC